MIYKFSAIKKLASAVKRAVTRGYSVWNHSRVTLAKYLLIYTYKKQNYEHSICEQFVLSPSEVKDWLAALCEYDIDLCYRFYKQLAGKDFSYANQPVEGDPLFALRKLRLSFLPLLAISCYKNKVPFSEFELALVFIKNTQQQNYASLISLQRWLAICFTYHICANFLDHQRAKRLLRLGFREQLKDCFGLTGAYPNNHLLADKFYVFVNSLYLKTRQSSFNQSQQKLNLLIAEFQRQILPDGSGFEGSSHYHDMATELCLLTILLAKNNRLDACPLKSIFHRAVNFQAEVVELFFRYTGLGNCIEDPIIPLNTKECSSALTWHHFQQGKKVSGSVYLAQDNPVRAKLYCLVAKRYPYLINHNTRLDFPVGGFHVYNSNEFALLVRTAPDLQFEHMFGHSHNDFGSLYAMVGGKPLFVDAGTYSYHSVKDIDNIAEQKSHNCGFNTNASILGKRIAPFTWEKAPKFKSVTKVKRSTIGLVKFRIEFELRPFPCTDLSEHLCVTVNRSDVFDIQQYSKRRGLRIAGDLSLTLHPHALKLIKNRTMLLNNRAVFRPGNGSIITLRDTSISSTYGTKVKTRQINLKTSKLMSQMELTLVFSPHKLKCGE